VASKHLVRYRSAGKPRYSHGCYCMGETPLTAAVDLVGVEVTRQNTVDKHSSKEWSVF
jgi:hypothetical protein